MWNVFVFYCVFLIELTFGLDLSANHGLRRSSLQRRDGGLCFEIPSWQQKPVHLTEHLAVLRSRYNDMTLRREVTPPLVNSETKRYIDQVIVQFLDLYLRNIRTEYQEFTNKLEKNMKEGIQEAIQMRDTVFTELTQLADGLKLPEMCNEERRRAWTLSNAHVADTFACNEEAKGTITEMGKYVQEMIAIIKDYMNYSSANNGTIESTKDSSKNVTAAKISISKATVTLGYELDVSLSNAQRHVEQSYDDLSTCTHQVVKDTKKAVQDLKELFKQCIYA